MASAYLGIPITVHLFTMVLKYGSCPSSSLCKNRLAMILQPVCPFNFCLHHKYYVLIISLSKELPSLPSEMTNLVVRQFQHCRFERAVENR